MDTPHPARLARTRKPIRRLTAAAVAIMLGAALGGCADSDDSAGSDDSPTSVVESRIDGDGAESGDMSGSEPTATYQGVPATPAEPAEPTGTTTPLTQDPAPTTPPSTGDIDASSDEMTIGKAVQIAVEKYGGNVVKIEADSYRGTPTWEVTLVETDQGRIEVHVSKATAAILKVEDENDD